MFTRDELILLIESCYLAAYVSRENGRTEQLKQFHGLAEKLGDKLDEVYYEEK